MSAALFLSDLHLEDSEPQRTQWFLSFLTGPAREAAAVYILGDLFEFWIGDDAPSVSAQETARALSELRANGVPCYFIHGNRDFLLGKRYAEAAGLELLPETCVIDLYGTPTLLLHGDTLCTDDVKYQAFRRQMRSPLWQAGILALPIKQRLKLAIKARGASTEHTGTSSMDIMDVNQDAVKAAFESHGVTRMIHGHTHRPAVHQVDLEGNSAERIVLADWYDQGSYLSLSEEGFENHVI